MGAIERDWLRRVGDYAPATRRVRREGPDGEPMGKDADGTEEAEAAEGEDGTEEEAAADGENGAPEQETPGEPRLDVPEEVDARRREERERERRTARNPHHAPQAFALEGRYLRGLAARFARMVSKVAEDSADLPAPGDDEWDLEELRMRRFTGRHVNQCRQTREKRKVAVVLDTSPSCEHQARLFGAVAQVAEALGDCDLYDAPNFSLVARQQAGRWVPLPEPERAWHFERRVVLAFGDFDGLDSICNASKTRGNKIYWFCCEERLQVLQPSRGYFLRHYKGKYLPSTNLGQLMAAMRRVR
jgi:hypothetical protein